jgi:integrase/recombinase XerD
LADHPAWDTVTTRELEEWLDGRTNRRHNGPLTARARSWWLSTLNVFYEWAVDEGLTEANPVRRAQRPKLPPLSARPLSATDVAMVLDLVPAGPTRRAVALMVFAGLRCCEVSQLRWVDVDAARGMIRLDGKGGKVRWMPISVELAEELGPRGRRDDAVIGRFWPARYVSRRVGEALRACGLDATAHQLRHTWSTEGYGFSPSLVTVQQGLGHASISTTQIYVQAPDRALRDMVDGIGAAITRARVGQKRWFLPSRLE